MSRESEPRPPYASCVACRHSSNGACVEHYGPLLRGDNYIDAHRSILRRIDEHEREVTAWESEFIESCLRRLDAGRCLTDKQNQIAHDIHDRLDGAS